MEKKIYLLPHVWQKIGLVVTAIGVVALILGIVRSNADMLRFFGWLISLLGAMMACFSREKVEDEFISSKRLKAVSIVALVYFFGVIINTSVNFLLAYLNVFFDARCAFSIIMAILLNNLTVLLLYFALFKIFIYRN